MSHPQQELKQVALIFFGAACGGIVGYYGCFWVAQQGFYGIILPGALLSLGTNLGRSRHLAVAVICGLAALTLGFFTEWRLAPFIADDGLKYFVTHLQDLQPLTMILIAVGGVMGFWAPYRRGRVMAW